MVDGVSVTIADYIATLATFPSVGPSRIADPVRTAGKNRDWLECR